MMLNYERRITGGRLLRFSLLALLLLFTAGAWGQDASTAVECEHRLDVHRGVPCLLHAGWICHG